ncbi:hypothetical protein [Marivita cryptomonadis]|jgi:hypothetical protein|uniref:hypothetical protein n=1 Tax=Marivita cryptomonadis TaxID=505252 RepID=UPI00391CCC29
MQLSDTELGSSSTQDKLLTETLTTLINLVTPLHQLLEAQETLKEDTSHQLEDLMGTLGLIASSLETSAEGLTKFTQAETLVPGLMITLKKIEIQQRHQIAGMEGLKQDLQSLKHWLGAPPRTEAGQR